VSGPSPKPWFRFYVRTLESPKVQRLSDACFKTWVNLLCLARIGDGALPTVEDIAFKLRLPEKDVTKRLETLIAARLIDETATGLVPHDWDEMQYASDGSADRMRRLRERKRPHSDGQCDVTSDATSDVATLLLSSGSVSLSENPSQIDRISDSKGKGK
jgi:hypothetical protein